MDLLDAKNCDIFSIKPQVFCPPKKCYDRGRLSTVIFCNKCGSSQEMFVLLISNKGQYIAPNFSATILTYVSVKKVGNIKLKKVAQQ